MNSYNFVNFRLEVTQASGKTKDRMKNTFAKTIGLFRKSKINNEFKYLQAIEAGFI